MPSCGFWFHSSAVRQTRLAMCEPLSASSDLQIFFTFAGFAVGAGVVACAGAAVCGSAVAWLETSSTAISSDMNNPRHENTNAFVQDLEKAVNPARFALHPANVDSSAMSEILEPEDCTAMEEVRASVDDIDRRIVALIARRFAFMDAAARIKGNREAVRDERRKAEVIANVKTAAADHGLDTELMGRLYEDLVESSIAYEFEEFDRLRSG